METSVSYSLNIKNTNSGHMKTFHCNTEFLTMFHDASRYRKNNKEWSSLTTIAIKNFIANVYGTVLIWSRLTEKKMQQTTIENEE